MSLEDKLHDREFITKMMLVGFLASLVFIGIGLYIIIGDILG